MGMYSVQLMWYDIGNHCLRSLQLDMIGSSTLGTGLLGSYPEHAWLIPHSLPDLSSDRQTRAQPVIDHCLVVLPT